MIHDGAQSRLPLVKKPADGEGSILGFFEDSLLIVAMPKGARPAR